MNDKYLNYNCNRCNQNNIILDYNSGDMICYNCGEIIIDRIIDERNEVHFYADDEHSSQKSSRTSGYDESLGYLQTNFICKSEIMKKTLERVQKLTCDPKEIQIISHLSTLNEMCSKMNLIPAIKVSMISLLLK